MEVQEAMLRCTKMRRRVAGWLVLGIAATWLALPPTRVVAQGSSGTQSSTVLSTHKATIQRSCETCHSARLKTGGLALEGADLSNVAAAPAVWEQVVRKLRVGAMPPQGMRRPDDVTTMRLISWLEGELDRAGSMRPVPGRPVLRRLNRTEYTNAIRDLLAIDVDVTSLLPPDSAAFGFDNVADAQASSPALLQAYLAAARKISAVAIGDSGMGVGSDTYSVRQDLSQDVHLEGLPLGTIGGLRARHSFPVDAEYRIPDQVVPNQPERDSWSGGPAGTRDDARQRASPSGRARRRRRPVRGSDEPDRHL